MLEHVQICDILPQGHPMVLVDRVLSLQPGVSITAVKAVSGSEPCYAGGRHFAFPVALLLESFGQAAALLWLSQRGSPSGDEVLMLTTVRDCLIEGTAYPGDTLRHVAQLDNVVGDTVIVRGETWVEGRRIAVIGSMVATLRPRSSVIKKETPTNGEETRRAP
jgi:3-hydroxyacyl-[acyl-carrier-protein] dehydratase